MSWLQRYVPVLVLLAMASPCTAARHELEGDPRLPAPPVKRRDGTDKVALRLVGTITDCECYGDDLIPTAWLVTREGHRPTVGFDVTVVGGAVSSFRIWQHGFGDLARNVKGLLETWRLQGPQGPFKSCRDVGRFTVRYYIEGYVINCCYLEVDDQHYRRRNRSRISKVYLPMDDDTIRFMMPHRGGRQVTYYYSTGIPGAPLPVPISDRVARVIRAVNAGIDSWTGQ